MGSSQVEEHGVESREDWAELQGVEWVERRGQGEAGGLGPSTCRLKPPVTCSSPTPFLWFSLCAFFLLASEAIFLFHSEFITCISWSRSHIIVSVTFCHYFSTSITFSLCDLFISQSHFMSFLFIVYLSTISHLSSIYHLLFYHLLNHLFLPPNSSSFCFYYLVLSPSHLNSYLSLNSVFHPYYSPYFSSLSPPLFSPPLFPHNHTSVIFCQCLHSSLPPTICFHLIS